MSTSVTIANTGAGDISSINNITESLGGIKLEDIKTEGCSGGDSDSDPSEESQSNSDSTGNTSLGQGLQLRPRSPASKGDLPEMTWEAAQLLLHHRCRAFGLLSLPSTFQSFNMPILAKLANAGVGGTPNVNTLAQHLGRLEVEDVKTEGCTGSESDSDPSDESGSNRDSTENMSSDQRGRPRPRSPTSKGGAPEIDWVTAQLLLHYRLFFWNHKVNQPPELYCWCISYVPIAMGIEAESQLWHVSLSSPWIPIRFQLQERLSHSHFREGQAFLMGHRLVLPSRSSDPRVLYRHPENSLVILHEDLPAYYHEFVTVNNLTSTSNMAEENISSHQTESPEVNPNPGINPASVMLSSWRNDQTPVQVDPSSLQGYLATGLVGAEETQSISGYVQSSAAPTPFTPAGAGHTVPNEVHMWMDVGNKTPTIDEIKAFTTSFRKGAPGKGAQVVICLHCPSDDERKRITDVRPWSLKRHLMIDFGIRDFHCNECDPPREFTFKDQLGRHTTSCHHTGSS
ncbi:unnamed protein product [Rhizoctonia solani]|uniref:C2H2-type domain-containing protein n=1 Tax=Rhizoctonia solani TaxID=456999 RepID=A0A8H3APD7_9AGAM|nr:unnamed protein product [Rhizoctonia solani]